MSANKQRQKTEHTIFVGRTFLAFFLGLILWLDREEQQQQQDQEEEP